MKASIAAAVTAATLVSAQNSTTSMPMPPGYDTTTSSASISLSTSTWDDCTTLPDLTITTTNTQIVTYCSECEMSTHTKGGSTVHTTVYTTVYSEWCPTGTSVSGSMAYMTPTTVTITESCADSTPTWSSAPTHVPAGYTTEVQICHKCGEGGMTGRSTLTPS